MKKRFTSITLLLIFGLSFAFVSCRSITGTKETRSQKEIRHNQAKIDREREESGIK